MDSKIIVNIPSDPFQQMDKKCKDLVNIDRPTEFGLASSDPMVQVNQLEHKIKFLQEQHQLMLKGLHNEIEILRQRNRDLLFKLVFSDNDVTFLTRSSPSSDEDSQRRKIILSPEQVNATPLQIELMERDIAELRTNLGEARTRNVYLQNIVDEQKKKLASLESEKSDLAAVGKKFWKKNSKSKPTTGKETIELHEKLEDADRLIRRLRRENEEQRKEIVSLRMTVSKGMNDGRRVEGSNSYRGYYRNSQSQTSKFPPLHGNWRNSSEYHANRNSERGGNRMEKETEMGRPVSNVSHLRDRSNASSSTGYNNPTYNNYRGGNHKKGHRQLGEEWLFDIGDNNRLPKLQRMFQPVEE